MVTRIIYTEISPKLEAILGRSWQKLLAVGLGFILAGILGLLLPRLVAFLVAVVLFLTAAVFILTAYHIWQLSRSDKTTHVKID